MVPSVQDLASVPPAQSPYETTDPGDAQATWVKRISQGVGRILRSSRAVSFNRKPEAVEDLNKCLTLLQTSTPVEFHWTNVTAFYDDYHTASRKPSALLPNVDLEYGLNDENDEEDEEDEKNSYGARPPWQAGDACIMVSEAPPYWGMARYEKDRRIIIALIISHRNEYLGS